MPKLQGIAYLRAVKAFEKAGFYILREGKHTIMTDGIRILVLPRHNPINAITMAGIIRDAGLTLEQFKDLL
jgi:predicted RNA binding protein YcfA (HicA-like mRNA interferase family)